MLIRVNFVPVVWSDCYWHSLPLAVANKLASVEFVGYSGLSLKPRFFRLLTEAC